MDVVNKENMFKTHTHFRVFLKNEFSESILEGAFNVGLHET